MACIIAIAAALSQPSSTLNDVLLPHLAIDLQSLFHALPTRNPLEPYLSCDATQIDERIYIDAINHITSPEARRASN